MPNNHLSEPITSLKGVGESTSDKLAKLGIQNLRDLVRFLPKRHIDYSKQTKIDKIAERKTVSFYAKIEKINSFYAKTGKLITQAIATDETGQLSLIWFNNPYIKRLINPHKTYTIAGKATLFADKLCLISPTVEEGSSPQLNTSGMVPIYRETKGLNSRWLRQKINLFLKENNIEDPLSKIETQEPQMNLFSAYQKIHFPKNKQEKKDADKRLSFNEHLSISLQNLLEQSNFGVSPKITINQETHHKGLSTLPFSLTEDQAKATKNILHDLTTTDFTHRLVQGDTGSGKTATIILAANQSIENKFSCALLAPTQILANQHYETFKKYSLFPDNVSLITSTDKINIDHNKPRIYIGTHSLSSQIPDKLVHPLLFVAIDEQHKFGVTERQKLTLRNPTPHLINLSATPIPRTVAQGLLGEIKISSIKTKPLNRLPIKTHVVTDNYFKKSGEWLNKQLEQENKIYVVSPAIFENSTSHSVEGLSKKYKQILTSKTKILTIHGKMKPNEQKQVLAEFIKTKNSVLISTSLIEVGIDIPSASIMVIHSAERFGLAQLHQLRGRVGRGQKQSYCFLVPTTDEQVEIERLQLLKKYNSGLILAKKDLLLRGSGEVFGARQHGNLQTNLKYFWSKKSYLQAKSLAKSLLASNIKLAHSIARQLNYC